MIKNEIIIRGLGATSAESGLERLLFKKRLSSSEIAVAVKFCSLTLGDYRILKNSWQDSSYPLVPGGETIGEVVAVGEEAKLFSQGDTVGVGYQIGSCFECEFCSRGEEQYCKNQKVIGVNSLGGIANIIITDERFAFSIKPNLSKASIVPFMCSGLTVYSALNRQEIAADAKIAVFGIGNLGHLALAILSALDHSPLGFTHSRDKSAELITKNQELLYLKDELDLKKWRNYFDLILWTSASIKYCAAAIQALKPDGTLLLVGLPLEKLCISPALLADYSGRSIKGSYIGSRQELKTLLELVDEYALEAQVEEFTISGIEYALALE